MLCPICAAFIVCVMMSFQVFDQYVKTRAEEERKEKKNKLMQAKDEFRRMMEDAKLTPRYAHTIKNGKVFKKMFHVSYCLYLLFHPELRLVSLL